MYSTALCTNACSPPFASKVELFSDLIYTNGRFFILCKWIYINAGLAIETAALN